MKRAVFTLLLGLFVFEATANYTNPKAKLKMSQIEFLVGNWQGEGWILNKDRKKETFIQTEKVEWRLDKTAILIEGHGRDHQDQMTTHHALAIISWQEDEKKYRFVSVLANGKNGHFNGEVNDKGQFVWTIKSDSGVRRFIIGINQKGQWHEIGEFSRDGENWYQFFEMTLDKVKNFSKRK